MGRIFIVAGVVIIILALMGTWGEASAQNNPPCAPRDVLLKDLYEQYSEVPVWRGLTSKGTVAELLMANNGSGTWTIVDNLPNGMTCIVGVGEAGSLLEAITPSSVS